MSNSPKIYQSTKNSQPNIVLHIHFHIGGARDSELLTIKQTRLLRFIEKSLKTYGVSPSIAEMAKGIGVSSLRSVTQHLESLQAKGFIDRPPHKQRGITLRRTHYKESKQQ